MNWTIEQAEKKIENLLYVNEAINKENKILDKTVDSLCCCGNCNMKDCDIERGNLDYNFGKYCDKWQSDGMARTERE